MNFERLRQGAPFDQVIVPGWLDRMAMRELNDNGYGIRLNLLLYPFEERWFKATVDATRRWERRLGAKTEQHVSKVIRSLKDRHDAIVLRSWEATPLLVVADNDFDATDNEITEIDTLEARAIDALCQKVAQERIGQATAKAELVLFEQAGDYAYLPPAGRVIVLSRDFLDEELLAQGYAERLLFRNVSTLEPGMVLALPTGADRDLIDARADEFLAGSTSVRNTAALWKAALKRHFANKSSIVGYLEFSQRLAAAGQKREPSTILGWISHTNTIAPSNFRVVVPIIASLTKDAELKDKCTEVLQSIDLIYRARARAADAIIRELFSGKIDINSDELRLN